jgi:vacuolar-type H+-ATPase subunit I/STV1
MSEDDLKLVLAKYQQKAFELFNQNIVFETQIEQLNKSIADLRKEVQNLSTKTKRTTKSEDF